MVSDEDKLNEIEREIMIRERFYPDWVRSGKISAARAKRQIDILQEIARDYRQRLKEFELI
jgi:hypothetical protein